MAWRAAFGIALAGIGVLSLLPSPESLPSTGWDKTNHLVGYGLLGWLARAGWPRAMPWRPIAALIVWGALIEILQGQTGYRQAEWGDVLANGLGAALGVALASAVSARRRQAERSR
jgi:VanZ family protein